MGMSILSFKTPESVPKEIWVYLLAYNLLRLMIAKEDDFCMVGNNFQTIRSNITQPYVKSVASFWFMS